MTSSDPSRVETESGPEQPQPAWLRPVMCTAIGLVGNSLLSAGKILVGLFAGSAALVADGYHSLADVLSDIGILLALKAANRPPDENHPYGHHSFETLGAVIVAAFMLITAIFIGRGAVLSIIHRDFNHPEIPALVASLVSVVIKELMARYTLHVGRLHNSPALLANGAMHRSDAISSLAAAVGIGGAIAGWFVLDSIGALVISLFILKMGWDLLRENVMALMDTMPDADVVAEIKSAVEKVQCIQEVRTLRVRQRGSWYLADLRIAVHPAHTIESAHNIAHQAEDAVRAEVAKIASVFVHVEPGERRENPECPTCGFSGLPRQP